MNLDPLQELYTEFSPYTYVGNMPLTYIDPDGRKWFSVSDKSQADDMIAEAEKLQAKAEYERFKTENELQDAILLNDIKGKEYYGRKLLESEEMYAILTTFIVQVKFIGEYDKLSFKFKMIDSRQYPIDAFSIKRAETIKDRKNVLLYDSQGTPVFDIEFLKDNYSFKFHETVHAYQMTQGSQNFKYNSSGNVIYTSVEIAAKYEKEAYRLQYTYDKLRGIASTLPRKINYIFDINNRWISTLSKNYEPIKNVKD